MLKFWSPSRYRVTRPLKPKRKSIEIAPEKGGDTMGRIVRLCMTRLKGTSVRESEKAITYPKTTLSAPTSVATPRLLRRALR
jgi:hypothetical protein